VYFSKDSPYYFYLHDNKWKVHYGRNLEEHNVNKEKYIR
jgi:cell division protein YceG involved in septum cleavage